MFYLGVQKSYNEDLCIYSLHCHFIVTKKKINLTYKTEQKSISLRYYFIIAEII